jgi:membrane protein YdbS with pleckstrin-like domain
MDRKDEHRQQKEKEREEKKKTEKAYEVKSQKERLPVSSVWLMAIGIVLTLLAVYTWMFWLR